MREINEESNGDEPLFKPRLTKEERPETILEVEDSGTHTLGQMMRQSLVVSHAFDPILK